MNPPDKARAAQSVESPRGGEARAAFIGGSRVAFFGGSFDPPHLGHLAVARAARDAFKLDRVLFAPVGMQPLKPEGPVANFEDRLAMTRLAIAGEPGFEISLADAPKSPEAPRSSDTSNLAGDRSASPAHSPNYSIDTLTNLRRSLAPQSVLYCLMGADSFLGLRQWHRAAEVPFVAPLIVASRPGQPLEDLNETLKTALPLGLAFEATAEQDRNQAGVEVRAYTLTDRAGNRAQFYVLPGLQVEISASEIRAQINVASNNAAVNELLPNAVRDYIAQHGLYRS